MRARDAVTIAIPERDAHELAAMLDYAADVLEARPIRTSDATGIVFAWATADTARALASRLRAAVPDTRPNPYTTAGAARPNPERTP